LHAIKQRGSDERLVRSLASFAEPQEVAGIDRILEHAVDFGFRHPAIPARMAKADLKRLLRQRLE